MKCINKLTDEDFGLDIVHFDNPRHRYGARGIIYNDEDIKLDSQFEKLDYNEKLDVFSEIIIRYDNETYFENKITIISFDSKSSGFDIANMIKKYKN